MKTVRRYLFLSLLVAGFALNAMAQKNPKARTTHTPPDSVQQAPKEGSWDKLVDQFFDAYFQFHPTDGTSDGFHQYDAMLEDYSRAGVDAEVKAVRAMLAKFEHFQFPAGKVAMRVTVDQDGHPTEAKVISSPDKSSGEEARKEVLTWHFTPATKGGHAVGVLINVEVDPWAAARSDRDMVVAKCNSRLLTLEDIRPWEKNPNRYSSGITNSAFVIMSRTFASPEERLKSLIARERQMPKVFDDARANLKNPPEVFTKVAIQQLPGIVGFFQKDVPLAFAKVKDPKLLAEFKQSNDAVIEALKKYEDWLKTDLLPNSHGDFRIGAENYRKKLLYDEMVDTPLDQLLKLGYDNLHENQKAFADTAHKIDPSKTPEQLLDELGKNHPAPDQLLQSTRDLLAGLRAFLVKDHIVTVPSQVMPIVEETPPFMRALTFASMDTPGPYEKIAKEAYFNVTLPEKDWTPQRTEEFMSQFNYNTLVSVAVHEAFPGHYTQFLWVPSAPSKVRKLLGCGSNAEGWAHYSEQMMLDEGYGDSPQAAQAVKEDKRALRLRLGQLQDALLRDARYIVGIEMHTGKMTFDQAVDFFVKEGYQSRAVAEVETKRGTSDPTYLVYTLGKLEILKLRADYKQMKGDKFSLQEFHDEFLKQGFPPVKIVRRALLGNDSPVL